MTSYTAGVANRSAGERGGAWVHVCGTVQLYTGTKIVPRTKVYVAKVRYTQEEGMISYTTHGQDQEREGERAWGHPGSGATRVGHVLRGRVSYIYYKKKNTPQL